VSCLAKIFAVLPKDLSEDDWSYVNEFEVKCGRCGWRVSRLYVLAESKEEAVKLAKSDAGLCGDCICEMLADEDYEVVKDLAETRCIVYWLKNGSIGKVEVAREDFSEGDVDTTSEEIIKYKIELGN